MKCSDKIPNIFEIVEEHRTIRKYKRENIPEKHLQLILHAGLRAPSSVNLQSYGIIRVRNIDVRKRLYGLAGKQEHILEAGEFLIFIADARRILKCLEKLGYKTAEANLFMFYVSAVDAALAAQNMVLAAEALGYGTCYIGAIQSNPCEVSEVLKLPKWTYPLFGLTIGVPDEWPDKRPRLTLDSILFEDRYPETDDAVENAIETYRDTGFFDSFIRRLLRYYGVGARYEKRNKLMCSCLRKHGFSYNT